MHMHDCVCMCVVYYLHDIRMCSEREGGRGARRGGERERREGAREGESEGESEGVCEGGRENREEDTSWVPDGRSLGFLRKHNAQKSWHSCEIESETAKERETARKRGRKGGEEA
jgi:hypothetical protein